MTENVKNQHILDVFFYILNNLDKSWQEYENTGKNQEFDYILNNSLNDNQTPTNLINSIKKIVNLQKNIF